MPGKRIIEHVGGLAMVIGLVVLGMIRPFRPGRFDASASTVSFLAQLFGIVGLILVPIGIVWLYYEARRPAKIMANKSGKDRGRTFALVSLIAVAMVGVVVILAAMAWSLTLGTGLLLVGAFGLWKGIRRLATMRNPEGAPRAFNPAPLYLVLVPVVAALTQMQVVAPAVESSRNTAIDNAGDLIGDLEDFHDANGRYPESLLAVWPDYLPSIVGIDQYHYEPAGDAYNLSFEQFTFHPIGTREIVVYNPLDEQTVISHASWRLTHPELQGWYEVHESDRPHWEYFWFD